MKDRRVWSFGDVGFGRILRRAAAIRRQKAAHHFDRIDETDARDGDTWRKSGAEARGKTRIEDHETAAIAVAADEAAEGLAQPQPNHHVGIGRAAEGFPARPFENGRRSPRNALEHDETERITRHIDA